MPAGIDEGPVGQGPSAGCESSVTQGPANVDARFILRVAAHNFGTLGAGRCAPSRWIRVPAAAAPPRRRPAKPPMSAHCRRRCGHDARYVAHRHRGARHPLPVAPPHDFICSRGGSPRVELKDGTPALPWRPVPRTGGEVVQRTRRRRPCRFFESANPPRPALSIDAGTIVDYPSPPPPRQSQ